MAQEPPLSGRPRSVLIELDDEDHPGPAEAPPVPDAAGPPEARAMQTLARFAARPPSRLARWFWRLLGALVVFAAGVAAWGFAEALFDRSAVLGWIATALSGLLALVALMLALREWAAFARLARLDALHAAAARARAADDLEAARKVIADISRLYAGRDELRWGRERLDERAAEAFDVDALFGLAEAELLAPLDAAARAEIEAAARQVAAVTALVPLALADLAAALTANIRMIRRIAEIYGGRSGTLGSWRLTRSVLTHLVATGAVAVGDDLIGSVAGGGVLSRVSRRFGEGVINGALTARVGIAALEVCRPLPFAAATKPGVTGLVRRALTGLFPGG